jgi:hypothetical protein
MKRLILAFYIVFITSNSLMALTVTCDHYGYYDSSSRNYKQGSWTAQNTDLGEGTGKIWNFALPTTGYVNYSYHSVAAIPGFPEANLKCSYSQFVNGYSYDGTIYMLDDGTDILTLGYPGTPNTVWDPPIPAGLPHYLGKTWQGTHTYIYGGHSIDAKVISEGTISTHLGTYPALCVRYSYTSEYLNYNCYQWETVEYGIIAYSNDLNGGMLYVLHEASPGVSVSDNLVPTPQPGLIVYPNPTKDSVTILLDKHQNSSSKIEIYNMKGQLIHQSKVAVPSDDDATLRLDIASMVNTSGVYILRLSDSKSIRTTKIVVNR